MTVSFDVSLGSSPSPSELPPYQLTVVSLPDDTFRVTAFKGREIISSAYSFEIVATAHTDGSDEIERVSLGQKATLLWNFGKTQRAFYGVVAAVRLVEASEASGTVRYHLRFVPRLWLLKRKRRTRIFQKQGVTDIVTSVLLEAGISARWQLTRSYPIREYCTQYEESDYHFVTRLLAEAGIYFYFPQGPALDAATLAAAMAVTAVGDVADAAASALGAPALGAIIGSVASDVAPLIPGDTLIGGDDAAFYPPIGHDDPAELLAASAAALAPEVGSAIGDAMGGLGDAGSAALGAASAIAGSAIAALTEKSAPVLRYLEMQRTTISHLDKITRFTLRDSVRNNQAAFRDYDPQRPMVSLSSAAVSSVPFPPSPLEIAAEAVAAASTALSAASAMVPGGLGAAGGAIGAVTSGISAVAGVVEDVVGNLTGQPMLEAYDHHGPFLFPKWSFAGDEAPRILRQKRRRVSIAEGESGCPDLSPGHRFALADHPVDHLDQPYVVTSVEHRGAVGDRAERVYWNDLECAPATVTYVPPRPERQSVQVALTATVVGPPGEEIHVDAMGQIKVQFHWDRTGTFDDGSSCWIRTMHPWGGAGWGAQFIPRVGMEVVVVFDGGDPDKPLVLGALYNGTHPSPFPLPSDKTRSGWRTQTSPGGGGSNELSFEDAVSREQIYVHAQRNLDEVVEKNHTLLVRNDEFLHILGNRMDTIEKNLEELVKGDHASQVAGNRIDVVTGNSDERVSGNLTVRVEGKERRAVQGTTDLEYADDLTTRARGCVTTLVGKPDQKRTWVTHAEGTARISGGDAVRVGSDKELVLGVGKSSIRVTADGIELSGGSVSVKGGAGGIAAGSDGLALSSTGDAQVVVGKKLVLKTGGAGIALDAEVKVDGSKILFNSPDQAEDPPPKDPDPPTKIALKDDQGKPLAQQRFLIKGDDGADVSGMTDKDGNAELSMKSGGRIIFPDLKMPNDSADGPLLPYVVRQGDYLNKLAFTQGFDADKVWNDPQNADLKKLRQNPNLLHPGDVLKLPKVKREGLPLSKGTTNPYSVKVPSVPLHLSFSAGNKPLQNQPYRVDGLGPPLEGVSDGTGAVTFSVPVHVREVQVVFTTVNLAFPVRIGDMDPIEEPSGVQKRLEHLGYYHDLSLIDEADRDRIALTSFQRAQGIDITGLADDATRAALVKAHGS